MEVMELDIPEVKIFKPKRFGDHRGFFSETYSKRQFETVGINIDFVQDNHTLSQKVGTLRGLHFQIPPYAQDKLVRVVRGAILDVAVDLRRQSPSYGKWVYHRIDAEQWNQILIPIGFAHGFCTLEPDTEVLYKVSNYYAPDHDRGVLWNDPELAIDWPEVAHQNAVMSEKDLVLPTLKELPAYF